MCFRKIFFVFSFFLVCLSTSSSVYAQNQQTTTFNFESSTMPYNWHTSGWTACSGECNDGNQTRTISCRDNTGNAAPSEANCAHTPRPSNVRTCDLPDCQWVPGSCPAHTHYTGGGIGGDQGDDKIGGVNQDQL